MKVNTIEYERLLLEVQKKIDEAYNLLNEEIDNEIVKNTFSKVQEELMKTSEKLDNLYDF